METESKKWNVTNWIIGIIFLLLGILNLIFVHPVPGLFYFIISCIYLPPFSAYAREKSGWIIPNAIKIILALFILWASLAVGDLMEMFESWLHRS
jgi:hypothetical protein